MCTSSMRPFVALGVLALTCGMAHSNAEARPPSWTVSDLFGSARPYVQGHRGYGANDFDPNPPGENTLDGFHQAFDNGVRVVELDLQQTADGKIVVLHDDYFEDFTCVRSLTYDQLLARRPNVPLFRAVLNSCRHFSGRDCLGGIIFAEIKVPVPLCDGANTSEQANVSESSLVDAVVDDIHQARMEDQVVLNSGSPSILRHAREQAPEIKRALTLNALQLLSPAEACAVLPAGLCPVKIPKNDCGLDWYNIGPIARLPALPGSNAAQRFGSFLALTLGCAGAQAVSLDKAAVLPAGAAGAAQLIGAAHQYGLEVVVWTVDTPSEWNLIAAAGADGITSNNIALGLASQASPDCEAASSKTHGRFAGTTSSTEASEPALALSSAPIQSSGDGAVRIELALPDAHPARIALFDIAGRQLDSREVGSLGPGRQQLSLGSGLHPGIYLVRLNHETGQARVKIVVR